MINQQQKKKKNFMTNPVLRRLDKVQEQADDGMCCTYKGVCAKTFIMLAITVGGIALFFILKAIYGFNSIETLATNFTILISAVIAALLTLILPFVNCFVRSAIPVCGPIYCFCQGYTLAFVCMLGGDKYTDLAYLALLITIGIVAVMLFLYVKRIIRVTEKFKSVIFVLFATSFLVSIVAVILSFIPATRGLTTYIMGNPLISIGSSVLFIIIAALFLLSDFDAVEKAVTNRLPKKYEWTCAYGLVFTVIWLYLKILSLLAEISGKS